MRCYISKVKDYFEYGINKQETITDNPPIQIYINNNENRIKFKVKTAHIFNFFTLETMELIWSKEENINQDKNKIK